MRVVFKVTVAPANKKEQFQITWFNRTTREKKSFLQSAAGIDRDEVEWLWKDRRNQLEIGEKLFRFLDGKGGYLQQALKQAEALDENLKIHLSAGGETANWPFELLAHKGAFLLPTLLHLVRSVPEGEEVEETPPQNRRLRMLFMACSPLDVKPELDFEKEEEAIFKITEDLAIDMEVEDTGSLQGLRDKLVHQQYDVVHLSGIAALDGKNQPYFAMENETGYEHRISPGELWGKALIKNPPRLLFLSGCRTNDPIGSERIIDTPDTSAEGNFSQMMVEKYHIPAVLGWGSRVSDREAIDAGKMLYRELSRGRSILDALQRTRLKLISNFPHSPNPVWSQLWLFSSIKAFDAIVTKEQRIQPKARRLTHMYLKNSRVRVLTEGFVGRRRQIQIALHALKKDDGKVGVIILGTGGLGKSCLAGKLCERFTYCTLIIMHGRVDTITLEAALKDAFIASQDKKGQQILALKAEITQKLLTLCADSFKERNYLLLFDDFEQNLKGADEGQPGSLLPEAAQILTVLLHRLPKCRKKTQLIITSRYSFSLPQQSRDLVPEALKPIFLTSLHQTELRKKARQLEHIYNYPDDRIVRDLLNAGHGNPRLMEWLNVLVGELPEMEVSGLLAAVKDKQEKFIKSHVIQQLLHWGGENVDFFLRWLSVYRQPISKEGLQQIGEKAGLPQWETLLMRGIELSLVEHDQARNSFSVTSILQEGLVQKLSSNETLLCHKAAFSYYDKLSSTKVFDPLLVEEFIYHGLNCGEEEVTSELGERLLNYLDTRLAFAEALRVGEWILAEKKQSLSTGDDAFLLNRMGLIIHELGNQRKAISYLEQALAIMKIVYGEKSANTAIVLSNLGLFWRALGDPHKALCYHQQALSINEAVFGRENHKVARDMNNLGAVWRNLGDYYKAVDYMNQALAIDESNFGHNHPEVSADLGNLGEVWIILGEPRKAMDFIQRAIDIDKVAYGWEHPNMARLLNNMGVAWRELGEYRKSLDYIKQALDIDEAVFGREHPEVASDLNNLGATWKTLGHPRKALDYYQQALDIDETVFGREHPNVAGDLNNLGAVYVELGEWGKAQAYFEKAHEIFCKCFGETHPHTKIAKNNLEKSNKREENGNYLSCNH